MSESANLPSRGDPTQQSSGCGTKHEDADTQGDIHTTSMSKLTGISSKMQRKETT
jgi:hypothetical protein